jgi:4-hydroxy-tetrahydrodipicolinate reductase
VTIRVGVLGAKGRMGGEVCRAVEGADDLDLVARLDLGDPLSGLADAQVVVDFTHPGAVLDNLRHLIDAGVAAVVGTSGFDEARFATLRGWLDTTPGHVLVAPNFGVGAVLMMQFARQAARFFDSVEVVELHHAGKVDAPSGTAVQTARDMRAVRDADLPDPQVERWTLEGARGAVNGGVRIHSVRLPGLNAHQEVLLGALGQVLSIRHDALGRDAYVPGVALAVQQVAQRVGLTRGLDTLMGLT